MALQSGRPGSEILEDALLGYLDEVAQTRALIERRFDDLENCKVKLVPGDEVFARLRHKIEALRLKSGS